MCLKAYSLRVKWFIDSDFSRHMIVDKSFFNKLEEHEVSHVTFGDNSKCTIEGIGSIGNCSQTFIFDVYYVNGLKHNLLSTNQLCDKGFNVFFDENASKVIDKDSKEEIVTGKRNGNVNVINIGETRIKMKISYGIED